MHIIESLYPRIIRDIRDCIYGSRDLHILCFPHFAFPQKCRGLLGLATFLTLPLFKKAPGNPESVSLMMGPRPLILISVDRNLQNVRWLSPCGALFFRGP